MLGFELIRVSKRGQMGYSDIPLFSCKVSIVHEYYYTYNHKDSFSMLIEMHEITVAN